MHLINTDTLELKHVLGRIPPYAILSHTWGENEVSYTDFLDGEKGKGLAGFRKIQLACEQARKGKLRWAWVDTCCIDNSSSAELSEAINSMFKWYRDAAVCYAYLEDFNTDDTGDVASRFKRCKWFTRGWTLQELIAPTKMIFYGTDWKLIGDKGQLTSALAAVTKIDSEVLSQGPSKLHSISVAKRMSWAAGRKTTRKEDVAYCLMGLFDVNMPMLYGEGPKAFTRLQEEILKESEDHSLFAWQASPKSTHRYRGIFADSPDEFSDCKDIVPFPSLRATQTLMSVTSRGVPLTSIVHWTSQSNRMTARAGLNCRRGDDFQNVVGIEIVTTGIDQYLRYNPSKLIVCPSHGPEETVYVAKSAHATHITPIPGLNRQDAFHVSELPPRTEITGVHPDETSFSKEHLLYELGGWVSDKAALSLRIPSLDESVLLLLWASLDAESRLYTHKFDVLMASADVHAQLLGAKKPRESFEKRVMPVGPGKKLLVVTGRPGKVQGFNMFCIQVKVVGDFRSPNPRKVRSVFSAASKP